MSGILLDTHAWIWFVEGSDELSKAMRKTINTALQNNEAHLAAISLWEISMLEKKKRIILEMPCLEWINKSIQVTRMQILPLTPGIAVESSHLPGIVHEDPADRMIIATARVEGLTLLTRDANIISYSRQNYISTIKV